MIQMIQAINEELLNITKKVVGKEDVEDAMRIALLNFIDRRITECEEKIRGFRRKYRVSLEKLYENLDLSWEQEEDYMEWDFAVGELEMLEEYKEKLIEDGHKTVC